MASGRHQESYRFVVVYRREPREIPGAAGEWRGWIARVPDPREREMNNQTEARRGFLSLDEVPEVMRDLMRESAETQQPQAPGKGKDR